MIECIRTIAKGKDNKESKESNEDEFRKAWNKRSSNTKKNELKAKE